MNQTLPTADLNTAGTTDVIPSVAIDRIIAQRNEGIALFMPGNGMPGDSAQDSARCVR